MAASNVTKKGLVTFAVGIIFGFCFTYMLAFSSRWRTRTFYPEDRIFYQNYIPESPYDHGGIDNVKGPHEPSKWTDQNHHSHAGKKERRKFESTTSLFFPDFIIKFWQYKKKNKNKKS